MLGEMIGEIRGKITVNRVLPPEGGSPKIESSYQGSGKILGIEVTDMGTYWSVIRAGGMLYGEGHGVMMTKDNEMATWKAQGAGRVTKQGALTARGSQFFHTQSQKLAHINSIVAVFEYEEDENGNTHDKLWEWK
ncbi:hypothetical protein ANME2D_03074 [Candidatus Methanoperedens nitroreducens]|uniref:Uncharacterized protein n=1 Tax=Candidatus Methanoperedens nitratireducens TaxID=1392998 RepID=A0A062V5H7_9EURY|nr:hypothetical protein [Candidatus Methanoperedens nitroreducens]KCZ71044.1 hypothetical protein ANME2D_03074 [Candidatus Methanoperedens nitroreducens]MDJ1421581.1 hypothetical protein [Candidatus Methanoperedens sp.]